MNLTKSEKELFNEVARGLRKITKFPTFMVPKEDYIMYLESFLGVLLKVDRDFSLPEELSLYNYTNYIRTASKKDLKGTIIKLLDKVQETD